MKYNPEKHHRRSIRLKGYDYSQEGLYFITICVQNREHLLGEIKNGEMILSECGKIADECWKEIPKHFPNAVLHEYIIMPNHIHGIIEFRTVIGANNHSPEPNNHSPHFRSPSKTIGSVVRGFKIGVTKWARQNTNIETVWQRNYYEHIIKDERAYQNISNYIINNPIKWNEDKFYK